ncbi:MAG: hypothetical protein JXB03_13170, partial [Spirochaetales bacterium]|nr:hypothetical protein [Spirochaetales bacterium]
FLLLSQEKGRNLLSGIRCVIVDEIHSIAENKRGTVLAASLEYLCKTAGEFTRIGLSATVHPAEKICAFLGGYLRDGKGNLSPRPVRLIRSSIQKKYDVSILPPSYAPGSYGDLYWQHVASCIIPYLTEKRTSLIFVNSRKMSETLSRSLNTGQKSPVAYAHHGSLSKSLRKNVEYQMRTGKLKAIVATNSLELGIDIGHIEQVIFVQPPFTVSSFIQKLGRAGHQVGAVSRGICLPLSDLEVYQFQGYLDALDKNELENLLLPKAPLDVLSQLVISSVLSGPRQAREVFDTLSQSYPYRDLDYEDYLQLLGILSGTFRGLPVKETVKRLDWDRDADVISPRDGTRLAFYAGSGTIPDRGYFTMKTEDRLNIGELDEEFVWERRRGDVFVFGNRTWKIQNIDAHSVTVKPWKGRENSTVFWKAEEVVSPALSSHKLLEALSADLCSSSQKTDALSLRGSFLRQGFLFEENTVYFEQTAHPSSGSQYTYLFLHTFLGGKINKALHYAIQGYFQKNGIHAQVFSNNRQILILSFDTLDFSFSALTNGFPSNIYDSLENSGIFGAHFREIANRFLLLPSAGFRKRLPLWINRAKIKEFYGKMKPYKDNPVVRETWRELIEDVLDCDGALAFLESVSSGERKEVIIRTTHPSALCDDSIFRMTNVLMYADDTPAHLSPSSSISLEYFRALTKTGKLSIQASILADFEAKLKYLTEEYCPSSGIALLRYIDDRIIIPEEEWKLLTHFYPEDPASQDGILRLQSSFAAGITTARGAALLCQLFGKNPKEAHITCLSGNGVTQKLIPPPQEQPEDTMFLKYILSFYGPVTIQRLARLYGFDLCWLETTAKNLSEKDDQIIHGALINDEPDPQLILVDNLEKLLRYRRYTSENIQVQPWEYERALRLRFESNLESVQKIRTFLYIPLPLEVWQDLIISRRLNSAERKTFESLHKDRLLFPLFYQNKLMFIEPGNGLTAELTRSGSSVVPEIGSYSFWELKEISRLSLAELAKTMKKEFIKGNISCDSLAGIATLLSAKTDLFEEKERVRYQDWKQNRLIEGNWFRIPPSEVFDPDTIEELEEEKQRVRDLMKRYGILSRDILSGEMKGLKISSLYRVLRLLELSGEIVSGRFITGMDCRQYTNRAFLGFLQKTQDNSDILYGYSREPLSVNRQQDDSGLKSPFYYALTGTGCYICYYHTQKRITGLTEDTLSVIPGLLSAMPLNEIKIDTIDSEPVRNHALKAPLATLGGIETRSGIRFDTYSFAGRPGQ